MRAPRRLGPALALGLALGCNDGLQPTPAPTSCPRGFVGICGHVTYRGTRPPNTAAVYIVAYAAFPDTVTDLLNFQPVPPPELPPAAPGDSTVFYTLPLANGRYEWIVAVWADTGSLSLATADSLLREAGYYRDPADTSLPGAVSVNGTGTDSIDFVVDFDHMHSISYFFPGAAPPP